MDSNKVSESVETLVTPIKTATTLPPRLAPIEVDANGNPIVKEETTIAVVTEKTPTLAAIKRRRLVTGIVLFSALGIGAYYIFKK